MKVVSVDGQHHGPDNVRMTMDERRRIGLALRALRVGRNLKQVDVAKKIKGVSVGTLQAIESAWYEVKDSNIEAVARFYGTSLRKLLEPPDAIAPTDPLFSKLRREHLEIAQAYKDAESPVRQLVATLLRDGSNEESLARLQRFERLDPEQRAAIDALMTSYEKASAPKPEGERPPILHPKPATKLK